MTQSEIISAIQALTLVVSANKGFVIGSDGESISNEANAKIKELIKLIKQ